MAAYMGILLHRRGCPRSLLRRSVITHPHSRRGEQQDSPRAQHYAIRRNDTIGDDADAPSSIEVPSGTIVLHGDGADVMPGGVKLTWLKKEPSVTRHSLAFYADLINASSLVAKWIGVSCIG